ncbi:MAG: YbhB/YbcL family Raf kinase inhibitor-like protein [Nitrosopumilus sp.]|nr:YbhB/YbcL family Raf kinase inhibitor-like protein [Nitrosopumilus sp.]
MSMKIESNAFQNGSEIPRKYGYKKDNVNPTLIIQDVPMDAKSLALIMDDPDAMGAVGKIWVHWVVWNIDPNTSEIKENSIPSNSIQGKTDFGEAAYGGPAPPDKEHTYVFKLYALDDKLSLDEGSTKSQLEEAMGNHVIAESKLEGKYAP